VGQPLLAAFRYDAKSGRGRRDSQEWLSYNDHTQNPNPAFVQYEWHIVSNLDADQRNLSRQQWFKKRTGLQKK